MRTGPALRPAGPDHALVDRDVDLAGQDAGLLAQAMHDVGVVLEAVRHDGALGVEVVHRQLPVPELRQRGGAEAGVVADQLHLGVLLCFRW